MTRPQRDPTAGTENKTGYNPTTQDLFSKIKANQRIQYAPETYTDPATKGVYEATVVYNPYLDGSLPIPGDYEVRVRCMIPSLFKHLPGPRANRPLTCQEAGLYPEFVAADLESVGMPSQPSIGRKIKVQFIDKHQTTLHYGNGFIVGFDGTWGAKIDKNNIVRTITRTVRDENYCKDTEKRFRKIKNPQSDGGVNKPESPEVPQVDKAPDGKPETPSPVSGAKAKCDVTYVMQQLKNEYDQRLRGQVLLEDADFKKKLEEVAKSLNIKTEVLLKIIKLETAGTYDPAKTNNIGATGFIQFMPGQAGSAIALGTSTDKLRLMSGVEQLDYVERYLSDYKAQFKSEQDVYLAVFYPLSLSKGDDFVLGSERSKARAELIAKQNGLFSEGGKKKTITKGDVRKKIVMLYKLRRGTSAGPYKK